MTVTFIGNRIEHHALHSGYDQLTRYFSSKPMSQRASNLITKAVRALPNRLTISLLDHEPDGWYRKKHQLATEIQAMAMICFRKSIYHWLYGESSFRWAGYAPRLSNSRVVVSFHQPPDIFSAMFPKANFIKKADAIIVCASNQKKYFANIANSKKVHLVHHGVDTKFFSPGLNPEKKKPFSIIFVGSWLRDFQMLCKVIEKSNKLCLDIGFDIITPKREWKYFYNFANVRLHAKISDKQLRGLYRQADALLLPIKDCAANNSILEAMACAKPVITTRVGGAMDYVDETCAFLSRPKDAENLLDSIVELMENPQKKAAMGKAARQKALKFDWKIVAENMARIYGNL